MNTYFILILAGEGIVYFDFFLNIKFELLQSAWSLLLNNLGLS